MALLKGGHRGIYFTERKLNARAGSECLHDILVWYKY